MGVGKLHFRNHDTGNRVFWSETWTMYSLLLTHLQLGKDREEIFDSDGKFVRGKEDVEEKEDTRFTHLTTFGDGARQLTQTYDGDRSSNNCTKMGLIPESTCYFIVRWILCGEFNKSYHYPSFYLHIVRRLASCTRLKVNGTIHHLHHSRRTIVQDRRTRSCKPPFEKKLHIRC